MLWFCFSGYREKGFTNSTSRRNRRLIPVEALGELETQRTNEYAMTLFLALDVVFLISAIFIWH